MITVFFNETGYYLTGEGVEIAQRCSPATTENGDRIFQPLHHLYKVLFLALRELVGKSVREDIIVYGDSRLIDEINGTIPPLDETCSRWQQVLRRHTIPSIKSVPFFRKRDAGLIDLKVNDGQRMLNTLTPDQKQELAKKVTAKQKALETEQRQRVLERFRQNSQHLLGGTPYGE